MSLPYYLRYPEDFASATFGWPFELKGTYSLILDLIYARDGKLMDDAHGISGALGMSVRKWNQLKAKLIEMGKLHVKDGMISNSRADKELIIRRTYQDNQAKNRARPNKNKVEGSPPRTSSILYKKEEPNGSSSSKEKTDQASEGASLFAEPKGFRERCKQAAGACLKPKAREFQLIVDLLARGLPEREIIASISDVADGKAAASVSTWKYFATALTNRRAERASKPTASASRSGADEAMPREQGVIVARWATIRSPTGVAIARLNRVSGELRKPDWTPFDGDPPPEVAVALASVSSPAEAA